MDDGWIRPQASEEFGDALVALGAIGLIVGTAQGHPAVGVLCGLMLGAMADALLQLRAVRSRAAGR